MNNPLAKTAYLVSSLLVVACSEGVETVTVVCGMENERFGEFVEVPSGSFQKGQGAVLPEERGAGMVQVEEFLIQIHEVTNAQFAAFVAETGYKTDAQKGVEIGIEGAGSAVFNLPSKRKATETPWRLAPDANWQSPVGSGSSIKGLDDHPVVHVSLNDARAYAAWAGGRLPSEEEWEHAARLGLKDPDRQSSGAFDEEGNVIANTWQGLFPITNSAEDGFEGTSPVGCFDADQLGLFDMIGNVWEWTDTLSNETQNTVKGGSFLCAENYCRRYRPIARESQDRDFSTNHIGFRIVKDLKSG